MSMSSGFSRLGLLLLLGSVAGCGVKPSDLMQSDLATEEPQESAPLETPSEEASNETAPPQTNTQPTAPPVSRPTALNLNDHAAALLPPQRPGMPRDIIRGQRVWRIVESFQTPSGVTARFAVVSFAEDDAFDLHVNPLLDTGRTSHPVSLTVYQQQATTTNPLPLELSPQKPETFSVLWTHSHSKVIGQVQQFAFRIPDDDAPLVFRSPPARSPPPEPPPPEFAAQALQVLRDYCSSESPGTVFWQRTTLTGIAGAKLTEWKDDLPTAGEFFVPGNPQTAKPFRLELTRSADTGDVQGLLVTEKGSGLRGRPTQRPSTTNLLLKDATARFNVRLYGHELYGEDADSPTFKLSIAPLTPSPSIMLE